MCCLAGALNELWRFNTRTKLFAFMGGSTHPNNGQLSVHRLANVAVRLLHGFSRHLLCSRLYLFLHNGLTPLTFDSSDGRLLVYGGDQIVHICAANNGGCDPLTLCTDILSFPQSRVCGPCPVGYTGDPISGCVDIDGQTVFFEFHCYFAECLTNNGGCDSLTTCTNLPGVNVACSACPHGFSGTGATGCVDINGETLTSFI